MERQGDKTHGNRCGVISKNSNPVPEGTGESSDRHQPGVDSSLSPWCPDTLGSPQTHPYFPWKSQKQTAFCPQQVTLRWNTPLGLTGVWRGCRGQRHVQSTGACQEAEGRPPGRGGGHRAKSSSERAGEVRPTGRDRSRGPTKRGGDVVSEPRSHVT